MMYEDKYENHFLNITCGRARFGDFATHTLNAIKAPGVPAALAALAPKLEEALTAFMGKVVARAGAGGTAQGNTLTEDEQWELMKEFIRETDKVAVQPAYYNKPEELVKIYPANMSGLTTARKGTRSADFEAYVKALEAVAPKIGAAPGTKARQLLTDYRTIANAKDTTESGVAGLIKLLGPAAEAVCWALWDVHCTGMAVHSRTPALARALFNYKLLPAKKRGTTKPKP